MKTINLERRQITEIYRTYMVNDFPEDELKPLAMILSSLDRGIYECKGLDDNGTLAGYAFFVKTGDNALLDYYAVVPEKRGQGAGSEFLSLMKDYFASFNTVIAEVEDPSCAESEKEYDIQKRRYDFYLRNGFRDTGACALLFGVRYLLLEYDRIRHSSEEICSSYLDHYKTVLPPDMFKKNVSAWVGGEADKSVN